MDNNHTMTSKAKKGSTSSHKDCVNCGACEGNTPHMCCSRCKISYYCDRMCQKAHWKEHKQHCITPAERQQSTQPSVPNISTHDANVDKNAQNNENKDHLCPICLVNPDDKDETSPQSNVINTCAMCLTCGCFVCYECKPKYEKVGQDCPLCRASFVTSKAKRIDQLKALIYDRPLGRFTAVAEYTLGEFYIEQSSTRDIALALWESAANKGYLSAAVRAAAVYSGIDHNGERITKYPRQPLKAFHYCEMAAKLGHAVAMLRLGLFYQDGDGVKQSSVMSLKWYKRAYESGNIVACFQYGMGLFTGMGNAPNLELAREVFEYGAKHHKHGDCQFFYGRMLTLGEGGPKNAVEGLKYSIKAAKQNVNGAAHAAGRGLLQSTSATAQDYQSAFNWFYKGATELNCPGCQIALGEMYMQKPMIAANNEKVSIIDKRGGMVTRDLKTAKQWFEFAASQGNAKASQWLMQIQHEMKEKRNTILNSINAASAAAAAVATSPQEASTETSVNDADTATTTKKCAICANAKSKSEFSKKQWQLGKARRCSSCIKDQGAQGVDSVKE